jgi:hypothetical protein
MTSCNVMPILEVMPARGMGMIYGKCITVEESVNFKSVKVN